MKGFGMRLSNITHAIIERINRIQEEVIWIEEKSHQSLPEMIRLSRLVRIRKALVKAAYKLQQ